MTTSTNPDAQVLSTDARQRLLEQFSSTPSEQHGEKWAELWTQNFLPWDKGCASPSLEDLLAQKKQELGLACASSSKARKRVLVPGCGKGYDVLLFASYGLDAVGVEISPPAVVQARAWVDSQLEKLDTINYGSVTFIEGDFYKDTWVQSLSLESAGTFDYIYDYTFLCAMPLDMRPAWASRMAHLLRPGSGYLICLEFPLYKPLETGGPPWGLTSDTYVQLLGENFEREMHFQPERWHDIGKGTDWMSVWRRRAGEAAAQL
ncbi:S-adenosyl-L-methionine-dependent methyltransferase [Geopyxis carbonaria]|nr:S-adenosyl-L-methionine-dependent methyltransferase [Geopyxis carbonaria]